VTSWRTGADLVARITDHGNRLTLVVVSREVKSADLLYVVCHTRRSLCRRIARFAAGVSKLGKGAGGCGRLHRRWWLHRRIGAWASSEPRHALTDWRRMRWAERGPPWAQVSDAHAQYEGLAHRCLFDGQGQSIIRSGTVTSRVTPRSGEILVVEAAPCRAANPLPKP